MAKTNPPAASGKPAAAGKVTAGDVEITHLAVRALQAGFRRAGRAWPESETTVPVDAFSDAQIEQLLAEPMLVVVPVSMPAEKKAAGEDGSGAGN